METIAYICSYSDSDTQYKKEISVQEAKIKQFCKLHNLILDDVFIETSSREDFKPVLIEIMSKYCSKIKRIIITDFDVISTNQDFKDWIKDEFKRMNVEIVSLDTGHTAKDDIRTNQTISNIQEEIKNIPSLPEIITKSIELMQDKNTSALTLSKIISNDVGLTARVLKLVNSAYYGFPKQITTIQQAVTILGFTTIKGIILSASIYKMFSSEGAGSEFNYKQFWKHSLLTASASKLIAAQIEDISSEDIFSSAFLHDIGKIILAQYDRKNYTFVCTQQELSDEEYLKEEEKYCGINHCELGNMVAYSWNLPEIFCSVITYHHTPNKSVNYKKECLVVHLANIIAKNIESNKKLNIDNITLDILEKLNISVENVNVVHEKLDEILSIFSNIGEIFE